MNSERRVAYSPHVVRHKTPNYARSFFRVCVTPVGYGLANTRSEPSVHETHTYAARQKFNDAGIVLSEIIWRELRHTGL